MIAELVSALNVDSVWPAIAPDIIKCIAKTPTFFTAGDLWTMCRSGEAFLVIVHDEAGWLAASVWRFEQANFVCLMLVGKQSEQWIPLLFERAAQIARAGGAVQLMATARVGLSSKIKKSLPSTRVIRHTFTVEV